MFTRTWRTLRETFLFVSVRKATRHRDAGAYEVLMWWGKASAPRAEEAIRDLDRSYRTVMFPAAQSSMAALIPGLAHEPPAHPKK